MKKQEVYLILTDILKFHMVVTMDIFFFEKKKPKKWHMIERLTCTEKIAQTISSPKVVRDTKETMAENFWEGVKNRTT